MGKKFICICTLTALLVFQSTAVSYAQAGGGSESKTSGTAVSDMTKGPEQQQISPEELQKLREQLKIEQEELKKEQEKLKADQDQLKAQQQELNKDREQLKREQLLLLQGQEQLKKDKEQLKKDMEKLTIQEKRNKLNSELSAITYMKYIKDLGYYKAAFEDEKLNTRNAILLFQSDHNMNLTGTWDNATKNMLINRLLSKELTYNDKISKAPTTGKWIVVNKSKRILTLYEGTKVIKKYPVAVGNPHTLTKSGKYFINNKLIDPDWGGGGFSKPVKGGIPENPLGSRWMGINRTDGSYGIHGTNSFFSIGKFISHGCIRMQNYMVEELFPLVPMKAPVWVGTQDELKKWGITQSEFTINN